MKNVLVAVNSFKETADAVKVSELFMKHLDKSFFNTIQKPISDGGDGFLEVCRFYLGLEILTYSITTPYDENYIDCNVGLDRKSKTIYIESAEVLGLKRIPPEERKPMMLSSKGLGDLLKLIIRDVEEQKFDVVKIIIGIGGTGTIDMGLGLCSRFGLKLFNKRGSELLVLPKNFMEVYKIEFEKQDIPFSFEVILDVINPILGKMGGIKFCTQKGALVSDLKIIESGWGNISKILINNGLIESTKKLHGAGGGLSIGLDLFKQSAKKYSDDFISRNLKISQNDSEIDMVITGEGFFDEQSLMGKGAWSVISLFEEKNIPIALCCGRINSKVSEKLSMNVFPMELITYVDDPVQNFEEAIKIACREISGMTNILTKIS